jgi:hypothetical protein
MLFVAALAMPQAPQNNMQSPETADVRISIGTMSLQPSLLIMATLAQGTPNNNLQQFLPSDRRQSSLMEHPQVYRFSYHSDLTMQSYVFSTILPKFFRK